MARAQRKETNDSGVLVDRWLYGNHCWRIYLVMDGEIITE